MNYKKFISVSFATLLLANTGAPVVANATTSSGAEALDEEVLKDIFDSSTDFNSIKMMNEIKKEQVEEEQPEETEDIKERLDEGTTSDGEATVDKAVEESSKDNTDNTESENVSETEINKETEATNAEAVNNSGSDELNTNNTDVNEESLNDQSRVSIDGFWGNATWRYDGSTKTYTIYGGAIGYAVQGWGSNVAPWLRKDSVLLVPNAPDEFYVEFKEGVSVKGAMPSLAAGRGNIADDPEYSLDAEAATKQKLRAVTFSNPVDCSQMTAFAVVFYQAEHLTHINNLSNIKFEKEMPMGYIFDGCKSLKKVEISGWTIGNERTTRMFADMDSLEFVVMEKIRYIGNDFGFLPKTGLGILSNGKKSTKLKRVEFKDWETDTITDESGLKELFSNLPYVQTLHLESLLKNTTITDLSEFFINLYYVEALFLDGWDTSNVTTMRSTFENLTELERLSTGAWDTSNVTDMRSTFFGCKSLGSLSLSGWNTSKVTTMNRMFTGTTDLYYLSLNNWEFREDVDMTFFMGSNNLQTLSMNNIKYHSSDLTSLGSRMFSAQTKLKVLNAKGWDLPNVTDLSNMGEKVFYRVPVESLDLSDWKIPKVTDMSNAFAGWNTLTTLSLKNWDLSNITDLNNLGEKVFGRIPVKTLDLSGWKTPNVTTMMNAFDRWKTLTTLSLKDWDTSNVKSMNSMFYYSDSLKDLDISGWDTSSVTDMAYMFCGMRSLTKLDVTHFDTSKVSTMSFMFADMSSLTELDVTHFDTSKVVSMSAMFNDMSSLTELDVTNFDTSNVTDMKSMFSGVGNLESLNLSSWDTSKVTTMETMFDNMKCLKTLDISDWDTSNVTTMRFMFSGTNVEELDLSKWNTSSATNMHAMFFNMPNLKKLDISGWTLPESDTINLSGISNMFEKTLNIETLKMNHVNLSSAKTLSPLKESIFQYTNNLKTLEAKGWDVSNVTSLDDLYRSVFNAPKQITEMDLSGWKTPNVTTMNNMFAGAENLESINLSGWNTKKVTEMGSVFNGAVSLSNLSLADWNTKDEFVDTSKMFKDVKKLERLTLGDEFRFSTLSALESPVSSKKESTGYWTREDGNSAAYAPQEFMKNFGSGDLTGGVYVAEVNIPYSLSNFKAENTTIGQASIISFDLETNEDLDSNLFTDDVMHFSVTANALPEEIEYESVDVSYVSLTNGKLTPITSKRYDKENKTIHFDVTETMLGLTNKIRITVNGTAWNNTTNSKENTSFLVDYNTDETGPVENSYLARKITGQTQVNNGQLSFSAVPEKLEFNPTKLIVTQEDMIIDRLVPDWGIQVSDYRGTNALSTTDKTVARQDWELLATMDAFTDSKGETVSSSALGLVYINERGHKEELSEKEAVVLETHTVENETAKENHETNVSWEEEKGLKTVVKNRNALNSNEEYAAQVNYELRVAP